MIFGMYQRDGKVFTFPISSRSRENLLKIIHQHIKPGSLYYTDDWHAYSSLSIRGDHVVITKEKGKPKGRNTILMGLKASGALLKTGFINIEAFPSIISTCI